MSLETRQLRQQTIDQPRFRARPPSCLFTDELKKVVTFTAIEDEITEFLTKTERTQNINVLLDRYYLLFKQYLQEKSSFY